MRDVQDKSPEGQSGWDIEDRIWNTKTFAPQISSLSSDSLCRSFLVTVEFLKKSVIRSQLETGASTQLRPLFTELFSGMI